MNERAHPDLINASRAKHLDRGSIRINTNFGGITLEAIDNATGFDVDGLPRWLTQAQFTTGPCFMNGPMEDRMLLAVADAIYQYLDRPAPAVRVDFETISAEVKKRRGKK